MIKNLPEVEEMQVQSLGQENPLEWESNVSVGSITIEYLLCTKHHSKPPKPPALQSSFIPLL